MTRSRSTSGLLVAAMLSAGCYHATFETGLPASTQVVDKPWAMGFIYGLIPPPELDVSSQCKNGVAKVETQHSVLNSLVGIFTLGIVTPMQITVTCAASNKMGLVPTGAETIAIKVNASPAEVNAAVHTAIELSLAQSVPVYFTH